MLVVLLLLLLWLLRSLTRGRSRCVMGAVLLLRAIWDAVPEMRPCYADHNFIQRLMTLPTNTRVCVTACTACSCRWS
jgi:hypothetical protein